MDGEKLENSNQHGARPTEKPDLKNPEVWIRTYVQKPFEGFEEKENPLEETRNFFRKNVQSRSSGADEEEIQQQLMEFAEGLFDPDKVEEYREKAEEELSQEN